MCKYADIQIFVRAINCRNIYRDDYMGVRIGVYTGDCKTFLILALRISRALKLYIGL